MDISDLRECPWLADTVADRIWKEWWGDIRTLDHVRAKTQAATSGAAFPFVLVAHRAGKFLGTVSVVDSNMEPCRDLSPWLSALWVDPKHRCQGVATSLVSKAKALGRTTIHLTATISGAPFYEKRGWEELPCKSGTIRIYRFGDDETGD